MTKKEKATKPDKKLSKKEIKPVKVKKEKIIKYIDDAENYKVLDIGFQNNASVFNGVTSKITIDKETELISSNYIRVGDIKEQPKPVLTTFKDDKTLFDLASQGYNVSNWENKLGEPKSDQQNDSVVEIGNVLLTDKPFTEQNISTTLLNEKIGEIIYLLKPKQSPTNLEELTLEQLTIIKNRLVEVVTVVRGDYSQNNLLIDTNYKINKINEELQKRIEIINWY